MLTRRGVLLLFSMLLLLLLFAAAVAVAANAAVRCWYLLLLSLLILLFVAATATVAAAADDAAPAPSALSPAPPASEQPPHFRDPLGGKLDRLLRQARRCAVLPGRSGVGPVLFGLRKDQSPRYLQCETGGGAATAAAGIGVCVLFLRAAVVVRP